MRKCVIEAASDVWQGAATALARSKRFRFLAECLATFAEVFHEDQWISQLRMESIIFGYNS
jgi:hypothetical protein